jgi:hypothetical protein
MNCTHVSFSFARFAGWIGGAGRTPAETGVYRSFAAFGGYRGSSPGERLRL